MKKLFVLAFLFITFNLQAAGLERMKDYFQNTQTAEADLQQTVFDKQGHKTQEVTGHMKLQKPSKFRWDYNKPYVQLIVGDGEKVWLFQQHFLLEGRKWNVLLISRMSVVKVTLSG
jgi:outer membrane lipoprotein carrier protein